MGIIAELMRDETKSRPANNPVVKAAELARPIVRARNRRLLESLVDDLLPVEAEAKTEIQARLEGAKVLAVIPGAKLLGFEPLRWRDSSGLPRLALYDVNDAASAMIIGATGVTAPRGLSWDLGSFYQDVVNAARRRQVQYQTRFTGLLPASVRQIVREVSKAKLFREVYLMAEPSWSTLPAPRPVLRLDPLLVGWDGRRLWLLAHFDLTPLERYVVEEFPG